jgi:stage V sporulation protein G
MVITSIRVTPINKQNTLAIASMTLCDCFVLRAMRLVEGRERRYLAMPSRQTDRGSLFEVYHPINRETRHKLERLILDRYETGRREEGDGVEPIYLGSDCEELAITGIRVRPYEDLKLKGFASLVLDDCLAVNGIKIIAGKKRRFVQMPNVKRKNGKFRDLAFPTRPEVRRMIEEKVFVEYEKALAGEADAF